MSYREEIARIYQAKGLRGFFKGYQGLFVRDVPGFAIYFGTYEFFKRCSGVSEVDKTQHNYHGKSDLAVKLRLFCSGGFAGMMTWTVAYPADTLKTRLQTQPQDCTKSMLVLT